MEGGTGRGREKVRGREIDKEKQNNKMSMLLNLQLAMR